MADTTPHILATEPPTSSCCNSTIDIQRVVTDTIVYVAERFEQDEPSLYYRWSGKTYDDPDGTYSVNCSKCGADLYAPNLNLEEM